MARRDSDELLHAMAESARDRERVEMQAHDEAPEPIDEATLDAFRQGQLSASAMLSIEQRLARDPALRVAMAKRAGVCPDPPATVRRAVLESLVEPGRGSSHGVRRLGSLAAAVVFVLAIFGLQVFDRDVKPLPQIDVWAEVASEVRGGSEIRGRTGGEDRISTAAEQPIVIYQAPTWEAVQGIEVGVYRRGRGCVERIDDSDLVLRDVSENDESGRFVITRPGDVVGYEPGVERSLWLVVGWQGDLPASIAAADELDDAVVQSLIAAGGRRDPYRIAIMIVDDAASEPSR